MQRKTPPAFANGVSCFEPEGAPSLTFGFPPPCGDYRFSVSDAESPTVVAVVVVINQQIQTTIDRRGPRQRAADEERLTVLAIYVRM